MSEYENIVSVDFLVDSVMDEIVLCNTFMNIT